MNHEMINANLNPEYQIKKGDIGFHHFRGTRIHVPPSDPLHPFYSYRIFPVRQADYNSFFGPGLSEERRIQFRKAMNYTELEHIHNPDLLKPEERPVPGPRTAARRAAISPSDVKLKGQLKRLGIESEQ